MLFMDSPLLVQSSSQLLQLAYCYQMSEVYKFLPIVTGGITANLTLDLFPLSTNFCKQPKPIFKVLCVREKLLQLLRLHQLKWTQN